MKFIIIRNRIYNINHLNYMKMNEDHPQILEMNFIEDSFCLHVGIIHAGAFFRKIESFIASKDFILNLDDLLMKYEKKD